MRVMFVITRFDVGGAQVHVRDLSLRLVADGHEVRVATGTLGPIAESLVQSGVHLVEIPDLLREIKPIRDLRTIAALRRAIDEFDPDIVSTHSSKAGIVGRIACKLTGTPCLFTAHGWAFTDGVPQPRRTLYRGLERLAAPLATSIVCVSEHDRRIGIDAGIDAGCLVTIHNGMPDVTPSLRAAPGESGPVRVVMVARFARQKDHVSLLQAARMIKDVSLDLIGDGTGRADVEAAAREYGIADRVCFHGFRGDVLPFLAQAHIFALSSHWEGFPRSTLEAMRAGLPVVVSAVGGAAEAIEDGVSGFAVPPGDVGALRDRLAMLVQDAQLRAEMGAAARRRFETKFTFDTMFERTLAVYEAVCRGTRQQRTARIRTYRL